MKNYHKCDIINERERLKVNFKKIEKIITVFF